MAQQLYLKWGIGETNTLDLQANGYQVLDGFFPVTAKSEDTIVTDRLDNLIAAANGAALDLAIHAINQVFEYARKHPSGLDGAWVYYSPDATTTPGRARLSDGTTILDSHLTSRRRANRAKIGVVFEHEAGWEGAEAQVPLSNGSELDNTSGLVVLNHDDATSGHDNWAQIGASVITGDLPANCRLEMVNSTSATPTAALLVWVGLSQTGIVFDHVLEAESAIGETPLVGPVESNGYYVSKTISTTDETDLLTWAIPGGNLSAARGSFVKAMARFSTNPDTSIRYRWRIQWGGYTLWEGPLVSLDPSYGICIRDLGDFRLPPWLIGVDQIDGVNLILRVKAAEQPKTISLDFVHLMPADGSRRYAIQGSLPQNNRLVDDGINRLVYQDNGAGLLRIGGISVSGAPLQLLPTVAQRLYFLQHSNSLGDGKISRTLTVKLFYRPRRSTL